MSVVVPEPPVQVSTGEVAPIPTARHRSSGIQRTLLVFGTIYFTLHFGPFPQGWWGALNNVAAHSVWHLSEPVANVPSGSGDRLFDWLTMFSQILLSIAGTAAWAVLGRKRTNDRWVHEYLRIVLRYTLALTLMGYGFGKTAQFSSPGMFELTQPLGESTPMGLLWLFMGYSPAYCIFSGVLEVGAGLLLLFRRTTTLGATLAFAVMLNVFMLNLCYDVPVKIGSFHYLFEAAILLIPDAGRLLNFFVLNRPTEPRQLTPPIRFPVLRKCLLGVKWALVALITASNSALAINAWRESQEPRHPLEGLWRSSRPATTGWNRVVMSFAPWGGIASVEKLDGSRKMLRANLEDGELVFSGKTVRESWRYRQTDKDTLILTKEGTSSPIVELRRDESKMVLGRRPFHWVQERPRTP